MGSPLRDARGLAETPAHPAGAGGRVNPPGSPRTGSAAREAPNDAVDDFAEGVRVEIAVAGPATAELVIEAIKRTAHTGNRGDAEYSCGHANERDRAVSHS